MCQTIRTNRGSIEYSTTGSGTPVLFFHGGHSNCRETLFQRGWDLSRYKIIIPSRPGYSDTPLGDNYTPIKTAEIHNALLDKLGEEEVIVVGISAGGLSALAFAADYKERTTSLILISAVTRKWLSKDDDLYKRGKKMFSPKMEKFSWSMFRSFFRIFPKMMTKTLFDELSTKSSNDFTKTEINDIKEMTFKQSSGEGFVADLDQDIDPDIIRKIECPTLILHSENDKSVPIDMAFYADKEIPHSVLKTFDNKWGHLMWVGDDCEYPIRAMNEFLNQK